MLNCSQAAFALLISCWSVVMLHVFARLHDRNAAGHKLQQRACTSDYPVYKQAKLCNDQYKLVTVVWRLHCKCVVTAVDTVSEKWHYSSSNAACSVCSVTYHSKTPQPAQCSIKWSEVCCGSWQLPCLHLVVQRIRVSLDQGFADMCLGADEALGKKFLAQEPPNSQPPSESPSPSPPKPSAPAAQPSTAPGPLAEALQQPHAQAVGQLATAQPGALLPERRPQLWPSGGNPLAAMPQLPGVLLPVAIGPLHMLNVACFSTHTASSDGMFCCLRILTGLSRG